MHVKCERFGVLTNLWKRSASKLKRRKCLLECKPRLRRMWSPNIEPNTSSTKTTLRQRFNYFIIAIWLSTGSSSPLNKEDGTSYARRRNFFTCSTTRNLHQASDAATTDTHSISRKNRLTAFSNIIELIFPQHWECRSSQLIR